QVGTVSATLTNAAESLSQTQIKRLNDTSRLPIYAPADGIVTMLREPWGIASHVETVFTVTGTNSGMRFKGYALVPYGENLPQVGDWLWARMPDFKEIRVRITEVGDHMMDVPRQLIPRAGATKMVGIIVVADLPEGIKLVPGQTIELSW